MPASRLNQYRLANGMRIATYRYPHANSITIQISLRVGPLYEPRTIPAGTSHLVEHLMVKRIQAAMIAAGPAGEVTGQFVGTTRTDQTEFVITIHRSDLSRVLAGVRSLFEGPPPSAAEIQLEQKVIRHEQRESRHDSEGVYQAAVRKNLYRGRAAESILGTSSSLSKISPGQLGRFIQTWYRPENTQLTLVGAIPASMSQSLRKLGRLRPAGHVKTNAKPPAAIQNKGELVQITRTTSPQVELLYLQPLPAISERQYPAWEFLADALDSFCFYRIRDLGLAYSHDLSLVVSPQLTGLVIEARLKPSGLVPYATELQAARQEFLAGLTGPRLEMLKRAYGKKLESRSDSAIAQAEQIAWSQHALGAPLPLESAAARVAQLKLADMRRLQAKLLAKPARVVCIGPVRKSDARAAQKILSAA